MSDNVQALSSIERSIRLLAPQLPGAVHFRMLNSLDHFDRAMNLFAVDREIASFRAITGQEEAATALIKAIQLRAYPNSRLFHSQNHTHKAAVIACVEAIASEMRPMLARFQLTFNYEQRRCDIVIPVSNFGVETENDLAIQFDEPLNLVHSKSGVKDDSLYVSTLASLASETSYQDIRRMVADQANARNTLLYASDCALPASKATLDGIEWRK